MGQATDVARFDFGRNWQSYLDTAFNADRLEAVRESIIALTGQSDLRDRVFIDVGCGSGVFSLAASGLGATVVSFDVDPVAVECCQRLCASRGSPASWQVMQGSILDQSMVNRLPPGDIVYAWGVLHHTGDMWTALRSAAALVAPGGLLCVALYNSVERTVAGSKTWLRVKRFYNERGTYGRALMRGGYGAYKIAALMATLHNPLSVARTYDRQRGMSLWHDWIDWLGGFPYEYASAGEVFAFGQEQLGLRLVRLRTTSTLGCNEFVFSKPAGAAASAPGD